MVGRNPENEAKRGVGLNVAELWATVTHNRRGPGGVGVGVAGSDYRNLTSSLGGG